MNSSELSGRTNISHSDPSGSNASRRTYSRASSADSIFEDISIRANYLFSNLDVDKKGYLDRAALAKVCETGMDENQLGDLIRQLDHDGDGRVCVEDFKRCLREIARRNSMIRASIREGPPCIQLTRKTTASTTSPTSDRSSFGSDEASSETEERQQSEEASRDIVPQCQPIRFRERDCEMLLTRLVSSTSNCVGNRMIRRQSSISLPELAAVDECFGSLNCQDHIYELYHLLLSENPSLSRMYEFILSDIMQFVHRSKQIQKRLEKQIECERGQHSADILRLSEELDQQVLLAEESARTQEREQVLAEFRSQLESKSAQVEQLMERLKQAEENNIQIQEFSPKLDPSDHRLKTMQNNLVRIKSEKARLEDLLTGTRAELVQTRTELTSLRQNLKEKSREFDNHIAAFIEVVKENSQLKRQLSLLQEVNRELCDANDGLCAVLERSAEGVDKASTLREATTACSLLFTNFRQLLADFQTPLDSSIELNERTSHPLGSFTSVASNIPDRQEFVQRPIPSRRKLKGFVFSSPLNTKQMSLSPDTFGEAILEQLSSQQPRGLHLMELHLLIFISDSGLSSLRDAPELESEMEVDSPLGRPNDSDNTVIQTEGDGQNTSEDVLVGLRSNIVIPDQSCEVHVGTPNSVQSSVEPSYDLFEQTMSKRNLHRSTPIPAMPIEDKLRIFRVMLAGDSAVGKTSLLIRLCDNKFTGTSVSTIGIDMKMRSITVDGRSTMLQIWDTAGQERFRSISASFYRKADGILLVYDCTSESSFLHTREWINTIQENAGRDIPVVVVANKVDLRDQCERQGTQCVSYMDGRQFAQEIEALFFETSALTGSNVDECAIELTKLLCAQEDYNLRRPQVKLNMPIKSRNRKCCNA
ncbi:Ras family protein [Paragonimus heterotremus]|uniref:Ras family protein n=1 Tax=Paragonimus heterotremus TaxID=100268 RepID=A0A8J4TLK7_9TREM|nr:Ras family protein [Paragonimus heterotremus]